MKFLKILITLSSVTSVFGFPILETLGELFGNVVSEKGKNTPSDAFKSFEQIANENGFEC